LQKLTALAALCGSLTAHAGLLAADGGVDTSFSQDGNVSIAFDYGGTNADLHPSVVIDSLDRVITFAEVATDGSTGIGMSRHFSNGSIDTSFGVNGRKLLDLSALGGRWLSSPNALRAVDGKFYLLVRVEIAWGNTDFGLCRLFVSGNVDPSFSQDGCVTVPFIGGTLDYPVAMRFSPDDRIVLGGYKQAAGGTQLAFARLNLANATLDGSFGGAGGITFPLPGVDSSRLGDFAVQADSRIVFVGTALAAGRNNFDVLTGRLTAAGALDTSYFFPNGFRRIALDLAGPSSAFSNDEATALHVDPRTRTLTVAGSLQTSATTKRGFITQIGDGFTNQNFGNAGYAIFAFAGDGGWFTDLAIDGLGRIYAYGHADTATGDYDLVLARLTSQGAADTSFGGGQGLIYRNVGANRLNNLATQLSFMHGKPLLAGYSRLIAPDFDVNLTRVWVDLIFADGND